MQYSSIGDVKVSRLGIGTKRFPMQNETHVERLDYDQAIDLLQRAGMTLSKYYETDLIVEYFIREKNYDIDEINGLLWEKDLSLLGQNTA